MSVTSHSRASGIIILTTSDGRVLNMRVRNVDVEITQEVEEINEMNINGSVAVHFSETRMSIDLDGTVDGMTITDPKKIND